MGDESCPVGLEYEIQIGEVNDREVLKIHLKEYGLYPKKTRAPIKVLLREVK